MPFNTRRRGGTFRRYQADSRFYAGRGRYQPSYIHRQQQQQQLHQEREPSPPPLPLDPALNYGEEFRARSQRRRVLISKILGIRHPDLLQFCVHNAKEISEIRARSHRYQSSVIARRRAKLAKLKLKERKKAIAAAQASQSTAAQLSQQDDNEKKGEGKKDAEGEPTCKVSSGAVDEGGNERKINDEPDNGLHRPTQSSISGGPQNDYSYHFICTSERPANFVRDVGLANRFEEYPKLRDLIRAKDTLIQLTNPPPFYLKADLANFELSDLEVEFDCVLIEPPLEEYRYMGQVFDRYWNWNEIEALNIGAITAPRSFVWMWVGAGEGLDRGRRCLSKWGFRRCEDICWVKTNANRPGPSQIVEPKSLFQRTKEHCLMGIKGTVLRSKDGDFIHANIDLDVIIEEEPEAGVKDKPVEIFHIIEHFCLGRRRLHLFSRESTIRPGWVSVGSEVTRSNYDAETYKATIANGSGATTGCTEEIERMRPKTPPAVKAAVAAQAAQAQAQQQAVAGSAAASVLQPSPIPSSAVMAATSLGAALLQQQQQQQQQHSESPIPGL